jgi:hypothetical protein
MPNGLISKPSRSAAEARTSRGNQASGTPITRPSVEPDPHLIGVNRSRLGRYRHVQTQALFPSIALLS